MSKSGSGHWKMSGWLSPTNLILARVSTSQRGGEVSNLWSRDNSQKLTCESRKSRLRAVVSRCTCFSVHVFWSEALTRGTIREGEMRRLHFSKVQSAASSFPGLPTHELQVIYLTVTLKRQWRFSEFRSAGLDSGILIATNKANKGAVVLKSWIIGKWFYHMFHMSYFTHRRFCCWKTFANTGFLRMLTVTVNPNGPYL